MLRILNLLMIAFIMGLANGCENNTPGYIAHQKEIKENCIKACKDVGAEMNDPESFGVGCTCK